MGAHVEAGQPDQGDSGQGEGARPGAEPGQGGGAQRDDDLGAFAGALIIGVVSELSTLVFAPNYRIGIPLCAIAVILVFRPMGLLGERVARQ